MNIRKNNTPLRRKRAGGGLGIATCGGWIAGLALAALVVSPAVLHAAVIDDFDGEQPGWTGWNPPAAPSDPAALAELVSHRLRFATQFTTATDPANPMGHFCDVYYSTDIPVQQGKTLVLKSGLVSVGPINIFASLAATDAAGGKYMFLWGRTEVALLKWSQSAGFSVAFWETHAAAYHDLVLALEITPDGDDLLIETAVVSKLSGDTLFTRTVRDTPASDWGVPDPLPHGWQVFGPDVGAPYRDDLKVVGLGVLHDTDGQQATAVVQFDNLEYRTFVPPETFVIDDYEHGQKFSWWHEWNYHSEWAITDGQLNVRPTINSTVSFIYTHLFELPEFEPVEFSVDLVSANTADASGGLGVGFPSEVLPPGADRAYALIVRHDLVAFYKGWEGQTAMYSWQELASDSRPKTISLTLTRQGANLRIAGKVVLRDDPQTVLFSQVRVDTPRADISGDPGPPPAGPVWLVGMPCGAALPTPGIELVFDNLICSRGAAPSLLGIHRQGATAASLVWPDGGKCVLESDSLEGPWRPCPEPMSLGEGAYTCTVPLGDSVRYFRLDRGFCYFDSFDKPYSHSGVTWATTAVVPGGTLKPTWARPGPGRCRILGEGTGNTDFMLRWDSPHWYRDCVGTVDIIDWGDAMEDAAFGIVLRARPETEMWFANTAGLPEERYAGLLTFKKADNPSESVLSISGPAGAVLKEQRFPAVNPDKEYRLRFWAVGDQLTLELFDKADLEAPIQTINVTDGRIQAGMHSLYGTKSAGGTYEVWIDQDSLNGTIITY